MSKNKQKIRKSDRPFSNIISFAEGFPGNSTGQPYFFVSSLDQSMADLRAFNYASLAVSEAASGPCGTGTVTNDPEDPRCVRLVLNGSWTKVPVHSQEWVLARRNLFKHHPEMKDWESMGTHDWFLAKLEIDHLWLIDWFGGGYEMPLSDYFSGSDGIGNSLK
ncbi:Oidioi.mRNA.OKI2018_I69.PAR.g10939.t1.cds [Oikopleura dioica]|uniref:Oidioi.mRNA.OKI2018_I69.PAR.g10939.t1.cds n=1 Tax=Oikopleura dioica TaxID=34765 RepID=A0ABN7RXN1_OIKDI|nr:Oidioi.mRNA.OKI2018_I69.PAR.g10939.t1.cds [Oikopleura dioica]